VFIRSYDSGCFWRDTPFTALHPASGTEGLSSHPQPERSKMVRYPTRKRGDQRAVARQFGTVHPTAEREA